MIAVHHLDDSRSQRILWLLEELGVPYEIKHHKRDPKTRLAPPALKEIHPLGKSPVIEDAGRVIAESGAALAAKVAGSPAVAITATRRRTRSLASSGSRSIRFSAQRYMIATFSPST